ncbi:ComF family protein [Listeria riparia]|uniref:Phosphoribosyltransferase n=1 Tax=Listeria riparia FSL S10-1204 TaxID=1265816 RepID=W7D9C5_9LIST|nr:ComF family protein [Listeria riparia]EUJ45847.1 phosphoribosyltransferase [Listeria riparia FSL S10-1204]
MSNYCLICGNQLNTSISWRSLFAKSQQQNICASCRRKLEVIGEDVCRKCGRPQEIGDGLCSDCEKWVKSGANYLAENVACFAYNNFAKDLMALYKYRGDYAIAAVFSKELIKRWSCATREVTIPLPISEERRTERGFNQTEGLLKLANIPFTTQLKREHTEKQSKKTRRERIDQEQYFFVEEQDTVASKEVLLIDDIYTTGATLHLAAEALIESGAKSVSSITIFR